MSNMFPRMFHRVTFDPVGEEIESGFDPGGGDIVSAV